MIVRKHNIKLSSRLTRAELRSLFDQHDCLSCNLFTSVFKIIPIEHVKRKECQQQWRNKKKKLQQTSSTYFVPKEEQPQVQPFPLKPLSNELSYQIISGFCEDSSKELLEEGGCA
ncbi:hypothetical protein L208DRAFT_1513660, partial [Tricholoma matsutake]